MIEEAFDALMATYGRTAHGDGPAAARNLALASHVDACERWESGPVHGSEQSHVILPGRRCGDGWLCPKAQEIRRLVVTTDGD